MKAKLVPLWHEWREIRWINCQKYIIDLTSYSTYRCFSSMCKWYLLFVNNNFVKKQLLKFVNWIYILLGNNHLGNIFAEVITIKTLGSCWLLRWIFRAAVSSATISSCDFTVVWVETVRVFLGAGRLFSHFQFFVCLISGKFRQNFSQNYVPAIFVHCLP